MFFTQHKSGSTKNSPPAGFQPIIDRTAEFMRNKQKCFTSDATIIPMQEQQRESDLEAFIALTSQAREWLARLKQLTSSIENLHRQTLMAVSIEEAKRLTAIIDAQVAEHQTTASQLRNALKQMGERAATSRDRRIQAATVQKLGKDFLERMAAFREMQTVYQEKYKSQLERQYLIVRPTATRVELDRLADAENPLVLSQQVYFQYHQFRCFALLTWQKHKRLYWPCKNVSMRLERSSRASMSFTSCSWRWAPWWSNRERALLGLQTMFMLPKLSRNRLQDKPGKPS